MSSFGEELRRERELRQITLREISESTKINVRYLEALERNDFKHLPGGVFNKGFVRAFAQYIGVDPEAMVNAYLLEETAQRTDGGSGDVFRPSSGNVRHASSEEDRDTADGAAGKSRIAFWSVVTLVVVAGLVVAGIYLVSWWRSDASTEKEAPVAAAPELDLTPRPRESDGTASTLDEETQDQSETADPGTDEDPGMEAEPITAASGDSETSAAPPSSEPQTANAGAATTKAPARPESTVGTLEATLSLVRPTTGRVNCDNRRVEILDGLATGTRMRFECVRFLLIDAADGGAVLVGLGDGQAAPLAADGIAVRGHHIAAPRVPARDSR